MSQQDDDLDHLQTAVQRLGNMSLNISNELDSQNMYVSIIDVHRHKIAHASFINS